MHIDPRSRKRGAGPIGAIGGCGATSLTRRVVSRRRTRGCYRWFGPVCSPGGSHHGVTAHEQRAAPSWGRATTARNAAGGFAATRVECAHISSREGASGTRRSVERRDASWPMRLPWGVLAGDNIRGPPEGLACPPRSPRPPGLTLRWGQMLGAPMDTFVDIASVKPYPEYAYIACEKFHTFVPRGTIAQWFVAGCES